MIILGVLMNRKPSRTFLYLALMMVLLFVIGLIVMGMLIESNRTEASIDLTLTIIYYGQPTTAFFAIQTATAVAVETQNISNTFSTVTP
jgi:hypothetical protein